jgi:ribosomal protein S18 acetylase RimI-like enzyme
VSELADLKLRPIQCEDAQAVAELAGQLGHKRSPDQVREWVEGLAGREDQTAFVAELAGEVVGMVEVLIERRLHSGTFGLIGGLVVKDGVRSRGVGRLLCRQAEEWSRQKGVKKIRVTSRSTREAAHRFYLRDGYETVKTSLVFEKTLER